MRSRALAGFLVALCACGPALDSTAARDAGGDSFVRIDGSTTRPRPLTLERSCLMQGDPTGTTDSTAALRDALACAAARPGLPVRLSPGIYRIRERIEVPRHVTIVGAQFGSFGVNGPPRPTMGIPDVYDSLPQLYFEADLRSDALVLGEGASIRGIQIVTPSREHGESALLRIAGRGVSIRNVKLTNGQWGIASSPGVDVAGLHISDVVMVAPQSGLSIAHATGSNHVENVHVWNNSFAPGDGVYGFVFGTVSALTAPRLSTFNYQTALVLWSSDAIFTSFVDDFCVQGVQALGTTRATFAGGLLFSHRTAVRVEGEASVAVSGAQLQTNGAPAVIIASPDASLTLVGNIIDRGADAWNDPAIWVTGARALAITGNSIRAHGHGIAFDAEPRGASVFGNTFRLLRAGSSAVFPALVRNVVADANAT
jgi:hypothetical protein